MKKLGILGIGESGVGAALLAQKHGWEVFLSDGGRPIARYLEAVASQGWRFEVGRHSFDELRSCDTIVKSPGIAQNVPVVVDLRKLGVEVISEIEWAYRFCSSPNIIAVTGTNGKTTTATLIHRILSASGVDTALCGNIGRSFSAQVAEAPAEWYVVETSSFQLEDVVRFRPKVAVFTNLYPNHLNRYEGSMEKYAAAKMRLLENLQADDFVAAYYDSPMLRAALEARRPQTPAQFHYYSEKYSDGLSAWMEDKQLIFVDMKGNKRSSSLDNESLLSPPNNQNVTGAWLAAELVHCRNENLREILSGFENVEHRLERVRFLDGVAYLNDSKATTVNAAWYALDRFDSPIIWIMGGQDKGNDYGELLPLVKQKVKALIALTKDAEKIRAAFAGVVPTFIHVTDMNEAVRIAHSLAVADDIVLLSPACASFDLFDSYEHRGNAFKQAVSALPETKS
ncbi:MAG: UDP-N-acetylmuramoyl-L-alanine--D-glutamate ligase [Bacteroidia bacterium]|nr:UDP-N-acetylmuramoyl-L-alanine--D-glutamate ligase [Bacteroidia bacterium]MDW8333755.1 UDP-N-acetylmuramoyl-L-alanine--D-glutamate ligase [Bacteroidia bacterium]